MLTCDPLVYATLNAPVLTAYTLIRTGTNRSERRRGPSRVRREFAPSIIQQRNDDRCCIVCVLSYICPFHSIQPITRTDMFLSLSHIDASL